VRSVVAVALATAWIAAGLWTAGCGGGGGGEDGAGGGSPNPALLDEPGAPPPETNGTRRVLVAALGDSITAGSPLWDPNPAVRRRLGPDLLPDSQYELWAERRIPQARFRNCGVFGERADQIALRLDACAKGAEALIVQGGINDIAQGRSVEQAAANLRRIVQRGKRKRLRVALAEVLPWNNGYPHAAPRIRELNALIHAIGRVEHVPVFPFFKALEDPRRPDRMAERLTIDGDHPSPAGYRRLGAVIRLP
jgi:lysophospholipase L1-like esterase